MDWSKVRQRAESRFAASLRGRLTLHLTRYRRSHDQLYELWLSFDGQKLTGVSDGAFYKAAYGRFDLWGEIEKSTPSGSLSRRLVEESLNLSVEALVTHESPILRALGMADERFGERRLRKTNIAEEHPLVTNVVRIRCGIEGIRLPDIDPFDQQTAE